MNPDRDAWDKFHELTNKVVEAAIEKEGAEKTVELLTDPETNIVIDVKGSGSRDTYRKIYLSGLKRRDHAKLLRLTIWLIMKLECEVLESDLKELKEEIEKTDLP